MKRQKNYYVIPRKPSGIYYYIVRDPVSRKTVWYKSTGTTDPKFAEILAQEWWDNGGPAADGASYLAKTTTFCDYLYDFWDFAHCAYFRELELMGNEPHEEHAYECRRIVSRYYRGYFHDTLLSQITAETMQDFILSLNKERANGKKLAPSTINSVRNVAMTALKFAKRKKNIRSFDFDGVLLAGGKSKERGILTNEEAEKLFTLPWKNQKSRIAAFLGYHTGMRLGEIRGLKIVHIHETKISVVQSWSGKKIKSTKNGDPRDIPITENVYLELQKYIKAMGFDSLDALLVPGNKPGIPLDGHKIRDDLYAMFNEIGIDEAKRKERNGICLHSFRHLLVKNLIEKGVNKAIGMKITGHRNSAVFDWYSQHFDQEMFQKMSEAIERVEQKEEVKEPIPFKKIS
jgi:integrase